ncbi:hypothetical protein QBC37DRAFT_449655 [Rhypophila decipiens]|uniref:Uncharacterized protein n=1 Tax=Rhypophila decipiens TaxID=261697 RepID=A0AAN6YDY3_9PEZI|nr:hypothetical protein QBC37DRAFT_449655 [Rhypophila decipiens]
MAKTKPTTNNSAHFRRTTRLSPSAYTKFSPHGPPELSRSDTRDEQRPEWESIYFVWFVALCPTSERLSGQRQNKEHGIGTAMAAQEAGAAPGGPGKAAPIDETLSSISSTSATITRFLRSVRAAHSHLAAVSRELSDLRLLLELMRDEQDIPLLLQAQVLALLHDCRGILARIRDMLEGGTSPTHWTSVVKPNMPSLRQSLEIFRRSLGLVLEVVHLSSLASDADATELGEVEEQIYDEVDHLRIEAALVEPIDESAMPVLLLSYLDAIVNCVRNSDNSSSQYSVRTRSIDTQSQAQTDTNPIPTPTSPEPPGTTSSTTSAATAIESGLETIGIEEGLEAVSLDQQQTDASQSAVISRQFETAGPWHPTQDIVLPFYSPPPQSPAPSTRSTPPQQSVHPSQSPTPTPPPPPPRPGLSHSLSQPSQSPISPHTRPSQHSPQTHSPVQGVTGYPQPGHSPASSLSQQMWNQQMWRYNSNSPIMRSDSFDSRVSSAEARSATLGPEKWTEPARDFGNPNPNGYTYPSSAYHSSRDPSIASIASVTSMNPPSTAPTDSPRSLFSLARHNTNNSSTSNNGHVPGPGNETPTSFNSMRSPSTASSVYSTHPTHPTPLTPTGHWNPSLYQPQPTNPVLSSSSSSTSKLSLVDGINQSAGSARLVSQPAAYASPIDIVPTRHLTDKGKPHDVFHIDASPTSSFIATKHSNNHIKIWSVPKNSVHSNTKITSYVTPQARSREYFIRSHAILSESATLIGITTHFGFNLEIHNFSKTSSSKKLQTIDDAHRWAASRRDAYQTNYAPLVVYRPRTNQINKFFLSRHPSAKKPFWEDTSQSIDLDRANLPFVPKFPELAYSANSPFLIAAAGPRPGENNTSNMTDSSSSVGTSSSNNNNIILIAWQMTPVSENKLQSRSPVNSSSISTHSGNSEDLFNDGASSIYSSTASPDPYHHNQQRQYDRHRPHRFITPSYPPLQNSLPSVLVAHSTTVVSIWIPANHADIPLGPGGKFRQTPVSAPERYVLIWDIMTNATRMFGIPNVQACVSPDCRFVAYCDPGRGTPGTQGKFVIIDVASGEECWRWPARDGLQKQAQQAPWASFGGQMENLSRVTVFEFSSDSRLLIVGDASGALGIYEVREAGHGPGGRYELGEMRYSPPGPGSWSGPGGVIGSDILVVVGWALGVLTRLSV